MEITLNFDETSKWADLLHKTIPVFAGILTASLGFCAALVIERIKARRRVREEIVQSVSLFFNELKIRLLNVDAVSKYSRLQQLAWDQLNKYKRRDENESYERDIIVRKYERYNSIYEKVRDEHASTWVRINTIEGRLMALAIETQKLYNKKTHTALHSLLSTHIKNINLSAGPFVADYSNMSEDEIERQIKKAHEDLNKKQEQYYSTCISIIGQIQSILKEKVF